MTLERINPTAYESYTQQGPGIGAGSGALDWIEEHTSFRIDSTSTVLEVGFGAGEFLVRCAEERGATAYGVDICNSCADHMRKVHGVHSGIKAYSNRGELQYRIQDISHSELIWGNDKFDIAVSTEVLEHVANPIFMFSEVKRTLKHGGLFCVAFPMPEDNYGHEGGKHVHCYPWFLRKESFEMFCEQMFFKVMKRTTNGSSSWWDLRNYKGPGVWDVFHQISGNFDSVELFKPLREWNGVA